MSDGLAQSIPGEDRLPTGSGGPYADLGPERAWRRAVAGLPPFALDPTSPGDFRLSRSERVATMGSCFAQHVSRFLQEAGYNFLMTEAPGAGEAVFSARYGNVYTTRQLAQLFARAYGTFRPRLSAWERADGRFVDPFRPRSEADGFATPEAVAAAREGHLARVRAVFEGLDTLILTLGLTEGWRDAEDGAALPLPPGVAGGRWAEGAATFVNAGVADMVADVLGFVDGLRAVNPRARLVLTVSPVPLAMTYRDRHVLVANASSKAALRVVADEVCAARAGVHYFPSYEIVTAPPTIGRYFAENLRAVTPEGVAHVMRCFLGHTEAATPPEGASFDIRAESRRTAQVVCDEDMLEG